MSSDRRVGRLRSIALQIVLLIALPGAVVAGSSAQDGPLYYPDDPIAIDHDDRPIPAPAPRESSSRLDRLRQIVVPSGDGESRRASNVNTLGAVPDSSWFTNRHGTHRLSPEELTRGPDRVGPLAEGTWRVVGHPGEGVTPKLVIEDTEGRRYLLKFEHPDHPDMRSAAEVICTKFFWAFGYHTPESHIIEFHPQRLVVDVGEIDEDLDPERILENVHHDENGRVRALASLWLDGDPLGPFSYEGMRADDPNDIFPHEDRRELRGLRVFAAWLNHTDVKPDNSLDTFVATEGERGHVRHHLMDFGSCMGSGGGDPKDPFTGYEEAFELDEMLKSLLSLGIYVRPAVRAEYAERPGVGNFESEFFQPWLWKPPLANPALERMDAADAFWAARIASRFTDGDVERLVATGELEDPSDREYVTRTLIVRRDKSVAYWLTRTNPLEDFRAEAGPVLAFANAAGRLGIVSGGSRYRARWLRLDNDEGRFTPVGEPSRPVDAGRFPVPEDAWGPVDRFGLRYAAVEVSTLHPRYPHWASPVRVALRRGPGGVEVVGVQRPRETPPPPQENEQAVVGEDGRR